ncbi:MAG: peptidylprolyl isomerase [Bacteroidetes bacterium]|nr:peptidylprolyl isomerase [Bacteroidota bacterium]
MLVFLPAFAQVIPDQSTMMARSPATFRALFKTTKGDFTIEVYREWSPAGADRLYQLLMTGFYNQNALFRVQKGYVVQFGIGNAKDVNYFWDKHPITDEPVRTANLKGTISYARDGMNSRTSQLFVNLKDNNKLDTVNYNGLQGFPPAGRVVSGFEVIEALFAGYGFEPANHQDSVMIYGNSYLKKKFPDLDYIIEAHLITSSP